MPISLQKGQKVSLTKGNPGLKKVVVGLGWDVNQFDTGGDFDLDAAAFLLGDSGKTAKSEDFVFYGNLTHPSGSVQHMGDNLTGEGDFQNIYINKNVFMMDASLTKSFFDDRLSFNLQGIDLTHGRKDGNVIYNKHMDLTVNNVTDSREVRLTVRYKFNTTKNKYKGKGAAEEEIRRL